MNNAMIKIILDLYPWAAILLCAYAVVLGGIALFGFVINLVKTIFGKDTFRWFYVAKLAISAAVAYGYYYLYSYKGFNMDFIKADPPKSTIIMVVCLCLPIALLTASDYFLLSGTAPKKKK